MKGTDERVPDRRNSRATKGLVCGLASRPKEPGPVGQEPRG